MSVSLGRARARGLAIGSLINGAGAITGGSVVVCLTRIALQKAEGLCVNHLSERKKKKSV